MRIASIERDCMATLIREIQKRGGSVAKRDRPEQNITPGEGNEVVKGSRKAKIQQKHKLLIINHQQKTAIKKVHFF